MSVVKLVFDSEKIKHEDELVAEIKALAITPPEGVEIFGPGFIEQAATNNKSSNPASDVFSIDLWKNNLDRSNVR
ncbi:MAG: hypothetical protein LUQ28_15875, partial [Methylococcaceae bacterium]|nr:hypothetical protein [Methylococcaceae bacterium]